MRAPDLIPTRRTAPALLALETHLPENRYAQRDIVEGFIESQRRQRELRFGGEEGKQAGRRERATRVVFDRAGVGFRHFVIEPDYYDQRRTTTERNARYMVEAVPLGEATLRRGLAHSGYKADEVDEFIVVSCTGYEVPGLDLHLAGRLGMRPDVQRTCVVGMGCYGAFPGLQRARQAVLAQPGRLALVLSLELCSLHFQHDDTTETVISSALFSDGMGMALVGMPDEADVSEAAPMPRLIHSATYCDYTTLEHMSFHVTDEGFRMYLSSYVPDLLAAQITPFVDSMLAQCGLTRDRVQHWGIHPGSSKIVEHVGENLGLSDAQTQYSHQVLHDYGNMSSATILFVLDRILECAHPQPGDYGVLLAFGPGLTMEGFVLGW